MSASEVEDVMRAEYRLLCQCDGFKTQFDAHAKDLDVHTIPRKLLFPLASQSCVRLMSTNQDSILTLRILYWGRFRILQVPEAGSSLIDIS
jgi:hypothetical protein